MLKWIICAVNAGLAAELGDRSRIHLSLHEPSEDSGDIAAASSDATSALQGSGLASSAALPVHDPHPVSHVSPADGTGVAAAAAVPSKANTLSPEDASNRAAPTLQELPAAPLVAPSVAPSAAPSVAPSVAPLVAASERSATLMALPAPGPSARTLSAVKWEECNQPSRAQWLKADSVRQLFPEYEVGKQLLAVVVVPSGRELPLKLCRSTSKSGFVCGQGWGAVRIAANLHPGQNFGANIHPINA